MVASPIANRLMNLLWRAANNANHQMVESMLCKDAFVKSGYLCDFDKGTADLHHCLSCDVKEQIDL